MLGVGGREVDSRLHRCSATMQGLLGVICVYVSYVGVGWGGVMSYLTVPSLTPFLPNMGGATGLVEVFFMLRFLCWLLFLCSVRWLEALRLELLPLV